MPLRLLVWFHLLLAVAVAVVFRQMDIAEQPILMVLAVVMAALPPRTLITTAVAVQELAAMEQMVLVVQLTVVGLAE